MEVYMNTNAFLRECLSHAFSHYWGYPGEKSNLDVLYFK